MSIELTSSHNCELKDDGFSKDEDVPLYRLTCDFPIPYLIFRLSQTAGPVSDLKEPGKTTLVNWLWLHDHYHSESRDRSA